MFGISSSKIIDALAYNCIIPCKQVYLDGCRQDIEELRKSGVEVGNDELVRCFNRVRYAFTVIKSTKLAYFGRNYVYLVPCLLHYRERYGEKWINVFQEHVRLFVEPSFNISIHLDKTELMSALKYSRKIPGYYDLVSIVEHLAIINKTITSIMKSLRSITLKDGREIDLDNHLVNTLRKILKENKNDIEKMNRRLEFEISLLLSTLSSRLEFLLELLIGFLSITSFSKRPWFKPMPTLYTKYLEKYRKLYSQKIEKAKKRSRNEKINPEFHRQIDIITNMIKIINNASKLFDNTRKYIDNYYPKNQVNKNTRSAANKLLSIFITSRLNLSVETTTILSSIVEKILPR